LSIKVEPDADLRSRLNAFCFPTAPVRVPEAHAIAVRCARPECGYVTMAPIGKVDPAQQVCGHIFRFDYTRGVAGKVVCTGCSLTLDAREIVRAMEDAGHDPQKRYDRKGNALADGAQRLADENTKLMAEVGRLTLHIQKLEREARKR